MIVKKENQKKTPTKQWGTDTYGYYATKLSYYTNCRDVQYKIIEELTKRHRERIHIYSQKIKIILRQMTRVREREWKVRDIVSNAEFFLSVKLKYSNQSKKAQIGRNLVYKYALESKIAGNVIAEVMKCGKGIPSKQRTRFTRSFSSSPDNAKLYHSFVAYIKQNPFHK